MKKSPAVSTLSTYWRQAVLVNHNMRCVFCGNTLIYTLDTHHIVHRNKSKILKYDYLNGVPVCRIKCHDYAETLEGREKIRSIIGEDRYHYLKRWEKGNIKDYCVGRGITQAEFRAHKLQELKEVINGNT